MKTTLAIAGLTVLFALASPAFAEEHQGPVTLEGKIVCAKCTLKEEGRDQCQNVLVVENEGKKTEHYYLAGNEVAEKIGYVCTGSKNVQITGTVSEKDGKTWLVATAFEETDAG